MKIWKKNRQLMKMSPIHVILLAVGMSISPADANELRVNEIQVENASAGAIEVFVLFDCDQNDDDRIQGPGEEYGCEFLPFRPMRKRIASITAMQLIESNDIAAHLAAETRIGLKITDGMGHQCKDQRIDGGSVIFDPSVRTAVHLRVSGDAISGISCKFHQTRRK